MPSDNPDSPSSAFIERKLSTILSADVAEFSRLMSEDEEQTLRTFRGHKKIFEGLVATHRGRVFNTAGDAILAEFSSAVEAVRCATDIQSALRTRNDQLPPNRQVRFRIGVNIGDVLIQGRTIRKATPRAIVRMGVVHCPEGRRIFTRLTVLENLRLGHYTRGNSDLDRAAARVYKLFPILGERRSQLGGTLSGGEQQMLAIGRALMLTPKLLLLDEPSLGLAPLLVQQIFATISEINREGTSVLLVEQNANMALRLADRAYVLETGQIALEGSGRDLLANDAVRRSYLGEL